MKCKTLARIFVKIVGGFWIPDFDGARARARGQTVPCYPTPTYWTGVSVYLVCKMKMEFITWDRKPCS